MDSVPVGVALAMGVAILIALRLGDLKMLDYDQVEHAIEEGYIATPITLDNLSAITQMSKYYLLRIFSAHTGLTPHSYLTFVRASKARQMMDQKISLADIALLTGFFDQSHLNRVFKNLFACPALT